MPTLTPPIHQADFPRNGTSQDQLHFLVGYAILAPSSHNTQPWLFEIEGNEVLLRADSARAMTALDPDGRELMMSCGAALQHLILAIHAFGYAAIVQVLHDPTQPDLLARVRLSTPRETTPDDELLFRFIKERHTHRGHFAARDLPPVLMNALQQEAQQEGASLTLIRNPEQQQALITLIKAGENIQNMDAAVRRDVADWIAPSGHRTDGIPANAMGIGNLMSHFAPLVRRAFDQGPALAEKEGELADNAPVLAVLSTPEEGPPAWIAAGRALGRVLLRARAEGVYASFFSQPIQVDEAWNQLRFIVGESQFPQLVFRLGYAEPVPATPRRPVDEVATTLAPQDQES